MGKRVAVVGTGIAGLGAAWLLRQSHQVTVFEAAARAGGHSNTVLAGDQPVDTGFIVYNERNYPRLQALFAALGVATEASDMSFAASVGLPAGGRLEWAGDNWRAVFAQKRNILRASHWHMLADILRFNRQAKRLLACANLPPTSLGEFLDANRYGQSFRSRYLIPMAAAIWSTPTASMGAYPIATLLRFFDNHGLLDLRDRPRWRTVAGGSGSYVQRILADLDGPVHLNTPIASVRRHDQGVTLIDRGGNAHTFDHVILATHADTSLALLEQPSDAERRLLGAFGFQENRAVLHSDSGLMPHHRGVWASWNYLADDAAASAARVSISYWMNRLQNIPGPRQYFVSLNPLKEPDAATVAADIVYQHPVFDGAAVRAQQGLNAIQGRGGLWYCGAWCGYGFHEDGLAAAETVVRGLGVAPPWQRA